MGIMNKQILMKLIADISALGGLPFYCFLIILMFIFKMYILSLKLFLLLIVGMLLGTLIKIIYSKSRPAKTKNETSLKGFNKILMKTDRHAFPSVHTLRITMISLSMIGIFSDLYTILFFTILVILVGSSRILLKQHDIWDVLGGIFFGVLSYITVTLLYRFL